MIRHKYNYILWGALIILIAGMVAYMVGYNRYISKYSGQFDDKIIDESIRVQNKNKIENAREKNRETAMIEGQDEDHEFELDASMDVNSLDMYGNESRQVIASSLDKINSDTKLTTISIDKKSKSTSKKSMVMPINMIGLTKVSLAKYYDYYINNMPTEEMAKGLLSIRIIKFNKEEVVVQKIYDESTVLYYVTEDNGYVKVFYADKKTVYESTEILMNELPVLEQENIKAGMFVKDKDELITILEGYSS